MHVRQPDLGLQDGPLASVAPAPDPIVWLAIQERQQTEDRARLGQRCHSLRRSARRCRRTRLRYGGSCTVLTMAYAGGHISGGHFNPAVTIGLWAGKRCPASDVIPYIVAQAVGAIAAAAVLYLI